MLTRFGGIATMGSQAASAQLASRTPAQVNADARTLMARSLLEARAALREGPEQRAMVVERGIDS